MKTPLTVLVVEDSDLDREIIRFWLNRDSLHRWNLLEAHNVADALNFCQAARFDAILLDFELPDRTGLEFLAALHARHGRIPWPVVMLTGCGSETTAVEAFKRGVGDYLVKGNVSAQSLSRALANALEKQEYVRRCEEEIAVLRRQVEELRASSEEFPLLSHLTFHQA